VPRIHSIDPEEATGKAKDLLDAVNAKLGVVPNMTKAMAVSPEVLEGYLGQSGALGAGSITAATAERIALGVAERNACSYCLSAHSYLAENVAKLDGDEIERARQFESEVPTAAAALRFAEAVLDGKGASSVDVEAAKEAGLTERQLAEIVGHVGVNVLTNYFNKTFDVVIDFPQVDPHEHAVAA
jgi:AhpD family alkylhydroperoxidase